MNTKKTIRKIAFVGMWLAIGSGMLILLIAAMGKQKRENCKGYTITLEGDPQALFFLDKTDISTLLTRSSKSKIKGSPKSSLNLQEMEEALEKNAWVGDAQLYFDNHAMLHVSVAERKPVARIFTAGGLSFYLDENNYRMSLSGKAVAKVPVFTGFPDKKVLDQSDSILLNDIKITAQYINAHSFWTSQVAQIDMVADCGQGCWEFEMMPVVGNHVVKLGNGEQIDQKFNRLFSFYQQVSGRSGFNKYKTIDVRFSGQVVGSKDGKSAERIIKQPVIISNAASEIKPLADKDKQGDKKESESRSNIKKTVVTNKPMETTQEKKQVRTNPQPSETSLKDEKKNEKEKKTPKAVMQKRN